MPSREKRKTKKKQRRAKRKKEREIGASRRPRCGLCGATANLTKTPCCDNWICDDEDEYVLFSYERNSCFRNHRRYTLCGGHFEEGHSGRWQNCAKCREILEPEMYAYFGTNEYNFETLKNPPKYKPTRCRECGDVIVMAEGGYSYSGGAYYCYACTLAKHPGVLD